MILFIWTLLCLISNSLFSTNLIYFVGTNKNERPCLWRSHLRGFLLNEIELSMLSGAANDLVVSRSGCVFILGHDDIFFLSIKDINDNIQRFDLKLPDNEFARRIFITEDEKTIYILGYKKIWKYEFDSNNKLFLIDVITFSMTDNLEDLYLDEQLTLHVIARNESQVPFYCSLTPTGVQKIYELENDLNQKYGLSSFKLEIGLDKSVYVAGASGLNCLEPTLWFKKPCETFFKKSKFFFHDDNVIGEALGVKVSSLNHAFILGSSEGGITTLWIKDFHQKVKCIKFLNVNKIESLALSKKNILYSIGKCHSEGHERSCLSIFNPQNELVCTYFFENGVEFKALALF